MAAPRDGELAESVAEACSEMARDDVLDRLLSRGVPVAPAFAIEELGQSDWFEVNGRYMDTDHPLFGPVRSVSGYATWSRTEAGFKCRAPMIGEHSLEVLQEFGVPQESIARLRADGAFVQWDPEVPA